MTLTEKDFNKIERLVREIVDEQTKHLPSRDEFFKSMDRVMSELQTMREELALTNHHLNEHESRITSLEEIHPQGQHATA
jgi:hypothetical protein